MAHARHQQGGAAMSTRDVKMVLSVEALGQENITKLQQALRDLAATGGAGSAEFEQLADEMSRLAQQTAAIQTVQRLTEETAVLRAEQKRESTEVQPPAGVDPEGAPCRHRRSAKVVTCS